MKKFIFLVILIVAAYLVYTYIWKPSHTPKQTPPPLTTANSTIHIPPQSPQSGIFLYEQGKYKEAANRLEEELKGSSLEAPDRCLDYLAWAYENLEKSDKALKVWERLLKEHPTSIYCGDSYYQLGKRNKDRKQKIDYLEKALKFTESRGAHAAGAELGDYYLSQKDIENHEYKARSAYSLALQSNISKEKAAEIKNSLIELNKKLIFSSFLTPDSTIYTVKEGDNLTAICKKYKVEAGSGDIALGHIRRINNLKSATIFPGDKLKIITAPMSVKISKSNFTLTLLVNDDFIKEYHISVGNPDKINCETPIGTFTVGVKTIHPTWYKRTDDGRKEGIPYGDPRNVLGTRWMGFKESPQLGIHGTSQPESIGKKISDGCIRMYNADVEELYDFLSEGSKIVIEE
ncbi:MAG: L,D-transpeptidase family protein [Planctomycetota bacterium]